MSHAIFHRIVAFRLYNNITLYWRIQVVCICIKYYTIHLKWLRAILLKGQVNYGKSGLCVCRLFVHYNNAKCLSSVVVHRIINAYYCRPNGEYIMLLVSIRAFVIILIPLRICLLLIISRIILNCHFNLKYLYDDIF